MAFILYFRHILGSILYFHHILGSILYFQPPDRAPWNAICFLQKDPKNRDKTKSVYKTKNV